MALLRRSTFRIRFRKDWRSPRQLTGLATNLGLAIAAPLHLRKTPYQEQWSVDIQRQLPWSIMADIGYTGTHGVALPATVALNQLPMSQLALGTQLTQTVLIRSSATSRILRPRLSQPTVQYAQLLRPFPQFTAVNQSVAPVASLRITHWS